MLPNLDRLGARARGSKPASTSTPARGPQPRTLKPTPAAVEEQLAELFGNEDEDEDEDERADYATASRPSRPSPRGDAGEAPGSIVKAASPKIV
jgi:hypothetical protein